MTDLKTIIDNLTLEQARSVLRTITAENQTIADQVIEIALAQHSTENWENIADGLAGELELLTPEEVWDRAGPTRDGYVDTAEAAEEMIDELLTGYLAEMKRYLALGMNQQSSELCKGLTTGLFRFERESESEFKNWAVDLPKSFADTVVALWKEGSPSDTEWQEFLQFNQDELGGWLTYSIRSRL